MKVLRFAGSAKADLSAFPDRVRIRAGYELFMVQSPACFPKEIAEDDSRGH